MSEPSIREVPQSAGALSGFLTDMLKSVRKIYSEVPTKRELARAGVISLNEAGGVNSLTQIERVVPPSPTGVVFSSAITNVLVSFDNPNYQGHAYTEMLRGDTNSYGNAIVVQRINGSVGAHPIGPARSGYYWVRHVSINFTGPPDSQTGTLVTTGQDVGPLLSILAGEITSSQLDAALTGRVNLIDGNQVGSVNARLLAEATARGTAITNTNTLRQQGDDQLASQITTIQAIATQTSLGKPLEFWNLNSQSIVTVTDGKVGDKVLRLVGNGGLPNQNSYVPIDRTKKYRTRFWARPSSNCNGLLFFSLHQFLDNVGNPGPVDGGRFPYKPSAVNRSQHNAAYGTDQWGEYSYVWDAADWQAGVKFVRPEFIDNYYREVGHWDVQDFSFTEVTALETNAAAINFEATTRANADSALTTLVTTAQSTANGNTAAIQANATTSANASAANASAITTLQASVNNAGSTINRLHNPTFTAQTGGIPDNWAVYNNSGSTQPTTLTMVPGPDGSQAVRVSWNGVNTTTKGIYQIPIKVPTKSGAWYVYAFKARAVSGTVGEFVDVSLSNIPYFATISIIKTPALTTEWQWQIFKGRRTAGDSIELIINISPSSAGANAYEISQPIVHEGEIFAGFNEGPILASLQTESTVRANVDGTLLAQNTVKIDVAGLISGYGLASTATNAAPTSSFGVRAGNFYIAPPAVAKATAPTVDLYVGYTWLDTSVTPNVTRFWSGTGWSITPTSLPFVVRPEPTTINGVNVLPGVYANDLYVANGTITNLKVANGAIDTAKIANLAVDTAKIADGTITNAKIANLAVDSAKIANAAITTAKIGDLAVDTLQIAGNAVTIPVAARVIGQSNASANGLNILSLPTISSKGKGVFIAMSIEAQVFTGPNAVDAGNAYVSIRVNDSVLYYFIEYLSVSQNKNYAFTTTQYFDNVNQVDALNITIFAYRPSQNSGLQFFGGTNIFALCAKK